MLKWLRSGRWRWHSLHVSCYMSFHIVFSCPGSFKPTHGSHTKRQKDKRTKRQKDKTTKRTRQKYNKTKKRVSYYDVRTVLHSCDVFRPQEWFCVGSFCELPSGDFFLFFKYFFNIFLFFFPQETVMCGFQTKGYTAFPDNNEIFRVRWGRSKLLNH